MSQQVRSLHVAGFDEARRHSGVRPPARVQLAKPIVAVAPNEIVNCVAEAAGEDDEGPHSGVRPPQVAGDAEGGGGAAVAFAVLQKHEPRKRLLEAEAVVAEEGLALGGLHLAEGQPLVHIVTEEEVDGAVAEDTDPVEEHHPI